MAVANKFSKFCSLHIQQGLFTGMSNLKMIAKDKCVEMAIFFFLYNIYYICEQSVKYCHLQNHYVRLQTQLQIHNAKIECFETVMLYHLYLKCLLKYHVDQVEASSK